MEETYQVAAGEPALLERESGLEQVSSVLARARTGAGGALVIEGAAGIGKTELIERAGTQARDAGFSVLTACGAELEREFTFGVGLQLLERVAKDDAPRLLTALPAPAARLLEAMPDPDDAEGENAQAVMHGLFTFVAELCEERPLAVIVDDAHWADEPSLRFLLYLCGRLDEVPVAVILAARPGEPNAPAELLNRLTTHRHTATVTLAPLTSGAVATVVRAGLRPDAGDGLCAECARVTAGNPFYLSELIHALRDEGAGDDAEMVANLETIAPETIRRTMLIRLGRLPEGARSIARVAAVLGDGATLNHAAALAAIPGDRAAIAADALAAAEILCPGEPLAFVHPLVRQSIYADIAASERAAHHREAARLLEHDGASPEAIAAHLLRTGPAGDPSTVALLRRAARRARRNGGALAAAHYLRRAHAEPPSAAERTAVVLELSEAELAAGLPPAGDDWLADAAAAAGDPEAQLQLTLLRGKALMTAGRHERAAEVLERALDELGDRDDDLAAEIRAAHMAVALVSSAPRRRATEAVESLRSSPRLPRSAAERTTLARLAVRSATMGAPIDETRTLAKRAWSNGALIPADGRGELAWMLVIQSLLFSGDYKLCEEIADRALDQARRRGDPMAFASAGFWHARAVHPQGRVAEAIGDLERALDACRYGWETFAGGAAALLAHCLVETGELAAAGAALAETDDPRHAHTLPRAFLLEARSRLRLAEGDPAAALEDAEAAGRLLTDELGARATVVLWRSLAAEAAHAAGDEDGARRYAAGALTEAETANARAHSRALRISGLIERGESGLALLRAAAERVEGTPATLEYATALTDLGVALRRRGDREAAREPLRTAVSLARAGGATVLCARADTALSASGVRPSRQPEDAGDRLTPSERRVAGMAAAGQSNREIAAALFVTVKAVEWHLANTYRKLGIRGRRELAEALGDARES